MLKTLFLAATAMLGMSAPAAAAPVISGVLGGPIVVRRSGDVIATFISKSAAYTDILSLMGRSGTIFNNKTSKGGDAVDLGFFTAGTVLKFDLNVLNTKQVFYSGPASNNSDGVAHVNVNYLSNSTILGFEDIRGGGDKDYNDLIATVSNTGATAAPEPATWALMIIGFGAVGGVMRRKTRSHLALA